MIDPQSESDEEPLLSRARAGDRAALDELLGRHRARLIALAEAEIGPALRARVRPSDVVQSTLVDVVESIESFRGEDERSFAAWLSKVLRNNVRDTARFFRAGRRASDRETSSMDVLELLAGQTLTPSAELASREELELIGRALTRLPSDQRQVLMMHMLEGRSHEQTAEALGRSVAASRQLLARARAGLVLEIDRLRSDPDAPQRDPA